MPGPDPRKNRKKGKPSLPAPRDDRRPKLKPRKKDQGDILGARADKKFKKFSESKEAQLQADDFESGLDRAERRAASEVAQEAGIPMARGGRVMYKSGMRVCKLAKRGKGRAYGKNS